MRKWFTLVWVFILCASLCGCGTSGLANQVQKAIEAQDYITAKELYLEKAQGNQKAEQAVFDTLLQLIAENYDAYNHEKKSYDMVAADLNTIAETQLLDFYTILESLDDIMTLRDSKEAFTKAENAQQAEDYLSAYNCYSQVIEADTAYDTAVKERDKAKDAYLKSIYEQVQESAKQGLYHPAYETLLTAANYFPQEPGLGDAITKLESEWFLYILACRDDAVGRGNYQEAYAVLTQAQEELPDGSMLDAELVSLTGQWKRVILEEADAILSQNKNYEGAIQVLQKSGMPLELLDEELANYQSYAPISLTSLEYIQKAPYVQIGVSGDDARDVNECAYAGNDVICPQGGILSSDVASTRDDAYVSYYLNQAYSTLTGVQYRPYRTLTCPYSWGNNTTAEIYGDGILLYEGRMITQDDYDALPFTLDISGVRELKIVIAGVWTKDGGMPGIYSRFPQVCLGNLTIQK